MKEKDIIRDAMDNFEEAISMENQNRKDALISSRFVDGEQWPIEIITARRKEKRPCLTINKLRKFIYQILGDIQQNRPSLDVRPVDSSADIPGAILRKDLIRHIEYISNAKQAYDNATLQALEGGYGYWRIITEYCDPNSFDQEIKIKLIPNRFSVVLDQHAEGKVYEDARYGFIINMITEREFKKLYGKKNMSSFIAPYGDMHPGWYEENSLRIAEYFWKDSKESKIYQLDDGNILTEEDVQQLKQLNAYDEISYRITKERRISKDIIKWVKMTQNAIIEGPIDFPGSYIPIVPVLGYEHNEEGYRRFRSLIHDAIDSMRMFNYWKTYATEMIALAPKAPYKITPQQLEGNENQWNQANISPFPYLVYNHIPGMPMPSREQPVPIPAAAVNEANMSAQDIQDVIGMYAPSLGEPSNERSGRAILARQRQSNNTVYTFVNNLQNALLHTGKILLEMIPNVYDTQRIIKVIGEDGLKELQLNFPQMNPMTLVTDVQNDVTKGTYDIIPTIGPTFATKRIETASSMLDFLQFVPQAAPIIAPKLADLMDWEGAQNIGQEMTALLQQQQPKPAGGSPVAPPETGTKTQQVIQ